MEMIELTAEQEDLFLEEAMETMRQGREDRAKAEANLDRLRAEHLQQQAEFKAEVLNGR